MLCWNLVVWRGGVLHSWHLHAYWASQTFLHRGLWVTSVTLPAHSRIHFGALLLTNGKMTFVSCEDGDNWLAFSWKYTEYWLAIWPNIFYWLQCPQNLGDYTLNFVRNGFNYLLPFIWERSQRSVTTSSEDEERITWIHINSLHRLSENELSSHNLHQNHYLGHPAACNYKLWCSRLLIFRALKLLCPGLFHTPDVGPKAGASSKQQNPPEAFGSDKMLMKSG